MIELITYTLVTCLTIGVVLLLLIACYVRAIWLHVRKRSNETNVEQETRKPIPQMAEDGHVLIGTVSQYPVKSPLKVNNPPRFQRLPTVEARISDISEAARKKQEADCKWPEIDLLLR